MLQAILVKGQEIKITFGDDHTILFCSITLGHREAVENLSFMIDTRLRRIKVLGLSLSNHPPTEPDDPLMKVKNRKQEPSSKSIVPTRSVKSPAFSQSGVSDFAPRKDQTQFPCQFEGDLLLLEMLDQAIPAVGRISQPVFSDDFTANSPLRDVLSALLALSALGEKIMKIV
jgi:hypothetical protein